MSPRYVKVPNVDPDDSDEPIDDAQRVVVTPDDAYQAGTPEGEPVEVNESAVQFEVPSQDTVEADMPVAVDPSDAAAFDAPIPADMQGAYEPVAPSVGDVPGAAEPEAPASAAAPDAQPSQPEPDAFAVAQPQKSLAEDPGFPNIDFNDLDSVDAAVAIKESAARRRRVIDSRTQVHAEAARAALKAKEAEVKEVSEIPAWRPPAEDVPPWRPPDAQDVASGGAAAVAASVQDVVEQPQPAWQPPVEPVAAPEPEQPVVAYEPEANAAFQAAASQQQPVVDDVAQAASYFVPEAGDQAQPSYVNPLDVSDTPPEFQPPIAPDVHSASADAYEVPADQAWVAAAGGELLQPSSKEVSQLTQEENQVEVPDRRAEKEAAKAQRQADKEFRRAQKDDRLDRIAKMKEAKAAYYDARKLAGKSGRPKVIVLVVLVVALMAASAFGTWYFMNQRDQSNVVQMQSQIDDLNKQLAQAKQDLAEAQKAAEAASNAAQQPGSNATTPGGQDSQGSQGTQGNTPGLPVTPGGSASGNTPTDNAGTPTNNNGTSATTPVDSNSYVGTWSGQLVQTSRNFACNGAASQPIVIKIDSIDDAGNLKVSLQVLYHGHDRAELTSDVSSTEGDMYQQWTDLTATMVDGEFQLTIDETDLAVGGRLTVLVKTDDQYSTGRQLNATVTSTFANGSVIVDDYTLTKTA